MALVQSAIDAICGGAQSLTIGDRTYRRADLDDLRRYEQDLLRRIDFERNHGRTVAEM